MNAPVATGLLAEWSEVVTVSFLGCDRRPVPEAPPGPVADLLADRSVEQPRAEPAERLLDRVAALAAMRRAGLRPGAALPTLVPCPDDPRPVCPAAAIVRYHALVVAWPELLDEWLRCLASGGWRLPGELAVPLLARHRSDPARGALIASLAGPTSDWLIGLFPERFTPTPRRARAAAPALALPDDMAQCLAAPADEVPVLMGAALRAGTWRQRHRLPLVRLVMHLPPASLDRLPEALERAATHPESIGLAHTLADLARFRRDFIKELTP